MSDTSTDKTNTDETVVVETVVETPKTGTQKREPNSKWVSDLKTAIKASAPNPPNKSEFIRNTWDSEVKAGSDPKHIQGDIFRALNAAGLPTKFQMVNNVLRNSKRRG
jgi:hypothetical protein